MPSDTPERTRPYFFSWVEESLLAASAFPQGIDQLAWLRENGIEIVVTLTEEALPKSWVDAAGLMNVHIPILDMEPPTQEQIDKFVSVINKAKDNKMGVLAHCLAGRGRTGTMLAAYLVSQGLGADAAIDRIRDLRPGSIEVYGQERVVHQYADRLEKN